MPVAVSTTCAATGPQKKAEYADSAEAGCGRSGPVVCRGPYLGVIEG